MSALIERASLWQWRNRLDNAVADVSKAIELDPKNSFAYVERGVFKYNMKKYDECLADFKQAIDLGSKAAVIHVCQGMIHLARKDPIKAKAEFESALQIDPKHADAYAGLASIFLQRSETSKALSVLDEAVRADPRSPDSYGNRAVVLLSRNEYEKALADLDDVIRLATEFRRRTAGACLDPGDLPDAKIRDGEQAVVLATRACELTNWKEPHCLTTLAAAYSEEADFDERREVAAKGHRPSGRKRARKSTSAERPSPVTSQRSRITLSVCWKRWESVPTINPPSRVLCEHRSAPVLEFEKGRCSQSTLRLSDDLADGLLFIEQIHRPAVSICDGGAGVDAEVVVERGEDVLE